nr:putative ribonuclease H-like domain-containing protein [Tanacetum cinerariifolium]
SSLNVSSTITKRIHNIHPTSQVIGDINSLVHTRSQVKHKGSSEKPTTVAQALADPDWVEAMQAEMQQFRNQKIFKYLTAYPKLGLWYPRDSLFDLEAFSDSDYVGAYGDRKSTTGGCQFLGRRLIFWQCKKQTIVAISSCEAEYVAAASCCGQWLLVTSAGRVIFCWLIVIPAGDLVPAVTSADRVIFCWLIVIPAGNLVPAGHILFLLAQLQKVSPPSPSLVVTPNLSTDPMPTPPRQSSPSPIPFGPAPSSGVASTDPMIEIPSSSRPSKPVLETITSLIRDDDTGGGSFPKRPPSPSPATSTCKIPSSSRPSKPVLETITSPIRDDDTGGGSFPERPPSPSPATSTCSPTRIGTLEAELKATKILHRDAVVFFAKRIKKLESKLKTKKRKLQSSSGLDFTNAAILAAGRVSVSGADPAVVISTGGVDPADVVVSAGGADPADVVVSAGEADFAGTFISSGISVAAGPSVASAPSSPIRDPAKEQPAELQETTSVFAGATFAAGDPIYAVPSVSAASSVPAETPIAAGVSTIAGVFELTAEHVIPLRKSSRNKSMARRRTLSRPSQSESAALSFDKDDPEAEFKKELMHWVGRADLMVLHGMVLDKYKLERATGIGLDLWLDLRTLITAREDQDASIIWDDQDQWEIQS